MPRFLTRTLASLIAATCLAGTAIADTYPSKPITLIVGYTPGGSVDLVARTVAEELGKRLGQPVVVENAAGAAGTIGAAVAEQVKVGYLPVTGHAKFFVAKEQGIFAKEGLDVELIEFQNSADGLNAIIAGKLDVGAFGTTAPVAHLSKGAKIKIIGGIMGGDAALIATPANASKVSTIAKASTCGKWLVAANT